MVSGLKFEHGTSSIQSRSGNRSTVMFCHVKEERNERENRKKARKYIE
jgi:hypothetical protein